MSRKTKLREPLLDVASMKCDPSIVFLQVAETKWFAMYMTQRMQHLRKVSSLKIAIVRDEAGSSYGSIFKYSRDREIMASLSLCDNALAGTARLHERGYRIKLQS